MVKFEKTNYRNNLFPGFCRKKIFADNRGDQRDEKINSARSLQKCFFHQVGNIYD